MTRTLITSGSTFEQEIGYSRAVVQGDWVFVSGTTGFDYETMTIPDGVQAQAEQCLKNIEAALQQAGSGLEDVVRVTYVLPDRSEFEQCWPVLRQYFGAVRPAAMMISANLLDPRMRIEIEVTAFRRSDRSRSRAIGDVVSPEGIAAALTEYWSPRVVAELDDSFVKVAKVLGSLAWHSHDEEDELFYVLEGSLRIEMEERTVVLRRGDAFVVPKGVRHNPIAEQECLVMLVERKTTLHTGNEVTDKTRSLAEQLRPV